MKYSDSKHLSLDGNVIINNKDITDEKGQFVWWKVDGDHFTKSLDKMGLNFRKNDLKEYLDFLTDQYADTNKLFYWVEYAEVYNLDDIDNPLFPHLRLLKDYFDSKNLADRFFILTENIYNDYKEFNTKRTTQWLGFHNAELVYYPSHYRKFSKTFLFLNRKHRIHREKLYFAFKNNGVLDDCRYSYRAYDKGLTKESTQVDYQVIDGHHMNTIDTVTLANTAFCHIVTETVFYRENYYGDTCFITEKVDKPIRFGSPFIVASTAGYLEELKKFGFKTFDRWWSEAYDVEKDSDRRLQMIIELAEEISNWSWPKKYRVYNEMVPTLIHNQRVRTAIVDFKKHNPVVTDEVLTMWQWTYYDDLIYYLDKFFLPSID